MGTRKKGYDRSVELLLYKEHYMIYKLIKYIIYYLKHAKEIDEKFKGNKDRFMIKGIKDKKIYSSEDGTFPMMIFSNMFKELRNCE